VYAGGYFTQIGGQMRPFLAALDATTGLATDWNPTPDMGVTDILADSSVVYASGFFSTIGGQARGYIAALDSVTGLATPWDPFANNGVNAMVRRGAKLYVAGAFTAIGGQLRNRIAALNLSDGLAASWDPDANQSIQALALDGPVIYAGGVFSTIGGQARTGLAALDAETGQALDWNGSINLGSSFVTGIAPMGSMVYVGGQFNSVAGASADNVAAISGITVDVPERRPAARTLALRGSIPNPVHGESVLQLDLARAGSVSLDLYDVGGRRVLRLLVDSWLAAGPHRVPLARGWLPAGLYFAELRMDGERATSKLVVVD
jgi:hypothetical protein